MISFIRAAVVPIRTGVVPASVAIAVAGAVVAGMVGIGSEHARDAYGRGVAAGSMPVAQDAVPIVASAYNAASDADAAEDVRIHRWMAGAFRQNLATGIAATNVGTETIEARLSLRDGRYGRLVACGDPCTANLPPRGTHYWWLLGELPGIPRDPSYAHGTAVVTGTQPVIVAVQEASLAKDPTYRLDASACRGLPAGVPATGEATHRRAQLPLVLRSTSYGRAPGELIGSGAGAWTDAAGSLAPGTLGIRGAGYTSVHVLNRDLTEHAQIVGEFAPQGGESVETFTHGVGPGEWSVFPPYMPAGGDRLPDGAYAATLSADRPVSALARFEWESSGAAAWVEDAHPSGEIIVPYVAGGHRNRCSLLAIQNANAGQATVAVVHFYAADGSVVLVREYRIDPLRSVTLRLCDDEDLVSGLPRGYAGWARVRSSDTTPGVAVQALVDVVNSRAAASGFQGVPLAEAADTLYAPVFHAGWPAGGFEFLFPASGIGPRLSSELMVADPGNEDAFVTVVYSGVRGACAGEVYTRTVTVPANGMVVIRQDAADPVVPAGCLASARIEASIGTTGKHGVPIVAVVYDEGFSEPVATSPALFVPYASRSGETGR